MYFITGICAISVMMVRKVALLELVKQAYGSTETASLHHAKKVELGNVLTWVSLM